MSLFYYITLIAMTILWEAPHQPRMGQELVAHTIMNRAELSGMNIEAVVMARGQFVGWTDERRMRWLTCAVLDRLPWCMDPVGELALIRTETGWREATAGDWWAVWLIAFRVVVGKPEPEGFEGVTNFDNPIFWGGGEPPWAEGKEYLGTVGDHAFYR